MKKFWNLLVAVLVVMGAVACTENYENVDGTMEQGLSLGLGNAPVKRVVEYAKKNGIDMVVANGENSADGNGITPASAQRILDAGADVITTGNHVFRQYSAHDLQDGTILLNLRLQHRVEEVCDNCHKHIGDSHTRARSQA